MFLNTSRYAKTPNVQVKLNGGRKVSAVKLRTIPATAGQPTAVTANDRLDVIAQRNYGDATRYWHVTDANTALDGKRLLEQWLDGDQNARQLTINIPEN